MNSDKKQPSRSGSVLASLKHKFSPRDTSSRTDTSRTPTRTMTSERSNNPYNPSLSPPTRRPPTQPNSTNGDPPPPYQKNPTANPAEPSSPAAPPARPAQAISELSSQAVPAAIPADDRYAFLSTFDTVFVIDDSGSMAGRSWDETGEALATITPICTGHDADGIDIFFLNYPDKPYHHNVTVSSTVTEIFSTVRPQGSTPTGKCLNKIIKPYLQRVSADQDNTKPMNIIVITDGEPSDDVESVIINAAKKLDKYDAPAWQLGIQFFQVGKEPGAKEHLKQLDDELAELAGEEDLRDIVDTVPFTGQDDARLTAEGILKVVLGAVHRRQDRKKSDDLHRKPGQPQ